MSVVTLFQTTFYRHCHFSKRLLYQFRHFFKRLFADTSTFSSDFRLRNYCKNLIEWTKQENFNFFYFQVLHYTSTQAEPLTKRQNMPCRLAKPAFPTRKTQWRRPSSRRHLQGERGAFHRVKQRFANFSTMFYQLLSHFTMLEY